MPEFLCAIRARAEDFGQLEPGELQQVLITEYTPGAAIWWHKDRSVFVDVVGISPAPSVCAGKPVIAGGGAI